MNKQQGRRQNEDCKWDACLPVLHSSFIVHRSLLASPRPSPLAPRPSPLRASAQRGISLMEVLVSIGIVAIGLVSVLSLLPVGGYQAAEANKHERKAALGLNAVQDLKNRGVFDTKNWVWYDRTSNKWKSYNTPATADFVPPIVIDPFMVGAATTAQYPIIENFPANLVKYQGGTQFSPSIPNPWHWLGMKRFTLAQACTPVSGAPGEFIPNGPLAQALTISHDDTFAERPDDASLPAASPYTRDASDNPLTRDFEGLYSWLITLTPTELELEHIVPTPKRQYLMSLVIFNRRLPAAPIDDGTQEEFVYARLADRNIGLGGGDFNLGDDSANADTKLELARAGNWLMLCRYEPTGATPASGEPQVWPMFHWYRIIAASDTEDGNIQMPEGGSLQPMRGRAVTLSGPNWQPATWPAIPAAQWPTQIPDDFKRYDTYACLFDNIIAVYQRPIWLEGPTPWAQ